MTQIKCTTDWLDPTVPLSYITYCQIYAVKQSKRLFIFLEKYPYTFIISYMIINFVGKSSPTYMFIRPYTIINFKPS